MNKLQTEKLNIVYVPISELKPAPYNARKWSKEATEQLRESIKRFGISDPLVANSSPTRKGIVIGGNFRLSVLKEMEIKEVPVVFLNLPDIEKEKELNIRLNRGGEFDWNLLANFDEVFLKDVGFSSEEIDDVFGIDETPEVFDLKKELAKLNIQNINVKRGEVYDLNGSRLMIGDSMIEADVLKLMGEHKADMCFTDPPYLLDYLKGKKKRNGDVTKGFGLKRDRVYLDTETLPDNFTELWMNNVVKIQKPDFSIIVYENPKNLKIIWSELEKHWKYRNTIIWHIPNRVQGFSAKFKFFNKHDFAIVGTSGKIELNMQPESDELLQTEYETALFATSGSPHWESYGKGKKYCPTDFIEHIAADEKSSGQGIIFGTKPLEILIPYIKILTKRDDLIFEPYGGSGSTLIASVKMNRRCFLMEKCPIYAEVILNRWSKLTGLKPKKIL
ncbi:ParB N-terminal domain-containing protein [Patescibacteria group bacterium]|nr:ParB N-terminal domain-containing protein [Patescibacteria group bacterium]